MKVLLWGITVYVIAVFVSVVFLLIRGYYLDKKEEREEREYVEDSDAV